VSTSFRIVAVAALTLAATSLMPAKDAMAQSKTAQGYVRLEPIESSAPQNDHPAQIRAGELRGALASIRIKGSTLSTGGAVFDDKELADIVPNIAAALSKAGPAEDVTFAVFGRHGVFGEHSPATVTSGRVFVQGGQLNVILGLMQTRYEDVYSSGAVELKSGQRARRVEQAWQASAEPATVVDKRGDWLRFDVSQLASLAKPAETAKEARPGEAARPAAESAPQKPAAADTRYQEIQSRLKVLDRLKADGLITEDEYRERRRAILQSL
jgi:hypothetical protein